MNHGGIPISRSIITIDHNGSYDKMGVKNIYLTPIFYCCNISIVMDDIAKKNLLYDFYGELLTDHQKTIYEDAVYNDCSLSELAQEYNISRQGVHDLLKRCDRILEDYEDKLGLVERFKKLKDIARTIEDESDDPKIKKLAHEMIESL